MMEQTGYAESKITDFTQNKQLPRGQSEVTSLYKLCFEIL